LLRSKGKTERKDAIGGGDVMSEKKKSKLQVEDSEKGEVNRGDTKTFLDEKGKGKKEGGKNYEKEGGGGKGGISTVGETRKNPETHRRNPIQFQRGGKLQNNEKGKNKKYIVPRKREERQGFGVKPHWSQVFASLGEKGGFGGEASVGKKAGPQRGKPGKRES